MGIAGAPPPALYPIASRALAGGRSLPGIVRDLAAGGATWIQVREKDLADAALTREIRECQGVPGVRLIVNDRPDIALVTGAAGVHLGDRDLPAEEARRLLGPGAIVGVSTHSAAEAIAACRLPVDYVALGPIFRTSRASVTREPLGVEAVAEAARGMTRPLVAIGGIDLDRARDLLAAGATSVAVISDLMTAGDIPRRVRAYLGLASRGR